MIKITKSGWLYIILTIFLGFSAINTNNNMVFIVTAFMLAVMGISGFIGKMNIENLRIDIVEENEIYANNPCKLKCFIENKKRFLPSTLMNVDILNKNAQILFVPPKEKRYSLFTHEFSSRGYFFIEDATVSSPFPFGFFVRSKRYIIKKKILVYPEPKYLDIFQPSDNKEEFENTPSKVHLQSSQELSNIRTYLNDPPKRIFWKHFAKTEKLYTKEYDGTYDEIYVIDFDDIIKKYHIEAAISISTGLILEAYESLKKVIFKMENKSYELSNINTKHLILQMLALYGKDKS